MFQIFLQKTPFARALIPFIAGIVTSSGVNTQGWILFYVIACLLLVVFLIAGSKGGFLRNQFAGLIFNLFLFTAGVSVMKYHTRRPSLPDADRYLVRVTGHPEMRARTYRAEALTVAAGIGDSVFPHREKLMVYFPLRDSLRLPAAGDCIQVSAKAVAIENDGNPHSFDYKKYMQNRGIYRQLMPGKDNWHLGESDTRFRFRIFSENVRSRLMAKYSDSGLDGQNLSIISALTLGYRKSLDPDIRQTFANAGAMHVLAVSGLHVGIVFLAFRLLFSFLKRNLAGRMIFLSGALLLLWGYALITGMSPSVQRAALMFSLVQIGDVMRRPSNIYNTLAASAFILLTFNPLLLYEVGFQLSYTAVLGIVYFQPVVAAAFRPANRAGRYIWDLFTVSVAAQIGTFALSSYYFNQFPVWFWITNLVVIPGALFLILLSAGMLVFSFIPVLSAAFSFLAGNLTHYIVLFLKWIEDLPGSVYSGFNFNMIAMIIILIILLFIVLFIETRRKFWFFAIGAFSVLYVLNNACLRYFQQTRSEIIIYRHAEPMVHIISGKDNYLLISGNSGIGEEIPYAVKNVVSAMRLKEPRILRVNNDYQDRKIKITQGVIFFMDKCIGLPEVDSRLVSELKPDIFLDFYGNYLLETVSDETVMVVYRQKKAPERGRIHELLSAGAFHIRL